MLKKDVKKGMHARVPMKRMAGSKASNSESKVTAMLWRRLQEGGIILLSALALFLFVALITYHSNDPGWSKTTVEKTISNAAGKTGAFFSDLFFYLFGYIAYMFPAMIAYGGFCLFENRYEVGQFHRLLWIVRTSGFVLAILTGTGLASLHFHDWDNLLPSGAGGILGNVVAKYFVPASGTPGSTLLLLAGFLAGITLTTGLSWFGVVDRIRWGLRHYFTHIQKASMQLFAHLFARMRDGFNPFNLLNFFNHQRSGSSATKTGAGRRVAPTLNSETDLETIKNKKDKEKKKGLLLLPKLSQMGRENSLNKESKGSKDNRESKDSKDNRGSQDSRNNFDDREDLETISSFKKTPITFNHLKPPKEKVQSLTPNGAPHTLPDVSLLEENKESDRVHSFSSSKLESLSREVEARLLEFGVPVTVVGVYPGPVITRFELELAAGVKVSRITSLSKDLARSLSVSRVRVVEVIPGKSVVGLEIPNEERELVRLREILESPEYHDSQASLSLALGKDISGEPVVVNLAKMPHLLVAGTTGSGKSVGINAMLLSLLFKSTPEDVRLILIDPKMLELSIYDGIPHLLTPVVTDMKDAANVLRWCVGEMERRYQLMAALGVRNLIGYNRKVLEAEVAGQPLYHPLWQPSPLAEPGKNERPLLQRMPYIVVMIDEFADMIMVVGKKVEELIARIAQKARAAGINMILATQRPSVDVITGLIKANVPTRIAFQVSSRIDSRTILDQQGAEQLLGHGDMLYLPPGSGIPIRIHGAFVSDEEVHAVVKALKQLGEPDYALDILGGGAGYGASSGFGGGFGGSEGGFFDNEEDELYSQAVQIVQESRKASISHLQRRLKIGYNRAARLVETMEERGVVSPMQSNGNREVLGVSSLEQ